MKEQDLREKLFGAFMYRITGNGVEKAVQITLDYAREEAKGFLEFTQGIYSYSNIFDCWYLHANTDKHYTTSELYDQYKIYLTTKTQNK